VITGTSRSQRWRGALTTAEWRRAGLLAAVVLALHLMGFLLLLGGLVGVGLGVTAYTLGLRHAFDADHIAAIDNSTRKLMGQGERPLSVGFFFSLGHSTIVFALGLLVVLGVRSFSALQGAATVAGPVISGAFLVAIGYLNLVILRGLIARFRGRGRVDEIGLEDALNQRGLLNRVFGRATRAVSKPWHMYPLGMLFGLGFDTATEVALLALAGTGAARGLPIYALLCLPILFAAGMCLFDTLDGAFMNFAYGWAFSNPVRKLFYNITVTGLSVAVAWFVGGIELLSVLARKLDLSGGVWGAVANVDLGFVGFAMVALFLATWAIAVVVWRLGNFERQTGS
jgi:nickel/cobalt transporter (NiCoT) family protein